MENRSIQEVTDPKTRTKLTTVQEMAYEYSKSIMDCKRALDEKRGIVNAAKIIADRIMAECNIVDRDLEEEEVKPEIAKERKAMIVRISNIVTEIGLRNQNDLTMLEGKLAGLELALNLADKRFKAIVAEEERKRELFAGGPHSPRGIEDTPPFF